MSGEDGMRFCGDEARGCMTCVSVMDACGVVLACGEGRATSLDLCDYRDVCNDV